MWMLKRDEDVRRHVQAMASATARDAGIPSSTSLPLDAATFPAFPAFQSCFLSSTRRALGALATAINATATVNALPLELLSRVASYLPFPDLCSATTVCRHWRETFLRDTSLWRELSIKLPDHPRALQPSIGEILERNKGFRMHLDLFMDGPADHIAFSMANVLIPVLHEHMNHIVSLYLQVPIVLRSYLFHFIVASSAPVLKDLALDLQPDARFLVQLPPQLFAGHAPELRRLFLGGCVLAPDSGTAVARVTYLHYDHRHGLPSYPILKDSLPVCPNLRTLSFSGGYHPDNTPPVSLPVMPSVRELRLLNTRTLDVDLLLSAFPNRSVTSMSFRAGGRAASGDQYPALDAFVRRFLPITSLDIRCSIRTQSCDWIPGDSFNMFTIHINGQVCAVDIPRALLVSLTTYAPDLFKTTTRCAISVHLLDVLCSLWPHFAHVKELEFYMDLDYPAGNIFECPSLPLNPTFPPRTLDALRIIASPVPWRNPFHDPRAPDARSTDPRFWRTAGLEQITSMAQISRIVAMVRQGLGAGGSLLLQELCDSAWPTPIALDVRETEFRYSPMPSHIPPAAELWCWESKTSPIYL